MARLGIIIASVREGRGGLPVAQWFTELARAHGAFEVSVIDLKDVDLPLLHEPEHPRLQKYQSGKTKEWSAIVAALDAFVIVTPEYNYGSPPALVNAFDHLYKEWNYKAVAFVSYGGVSGGTRSVQMTKSIAAALKMVPLVEAVNLPFYNRLFDQPSGRFTPGDTHDKAAKKMLDELVRWTSALASLRE